MTSNTADYIVDLTEANFAAVIDRSRQVPVLVDFWADWCAPCKQIGPMLDKLAREMKGRFVLAKVNADAEPLVTQQFGVRGLPTLKVVWQGQLAGELVGAHPEAAVRNLLQPFLGDAVPGEEEVEEPDFHAVVMSAVQQGRMEDALAALTEQLRTDPEDHRTRVMLAELLLQEGRLDEATEVLDSAPASAAGDLRRPRALLAFARRAETLPPLQALQERLQAGQPDTELHFHYALRLVTANQVEDGLDRLLDILRRDRQYGEDAARKALLEILEMLGRDDPLTPVYRRRMANYLL